AEEHHDRALAVGAGDSRDWRLEKAAGELDFSDYRNSASGRSPQQNRIARNSRTGDDQVDAFHPARVFEAQLQRARGKFAALDIDAAVRHYEFGAARGKEPRRGDAADSHSHHHHAFVRQFHQRSFSVLSATSAQTIDTIQNLITTRVSGMPWSSK